MDIILIKIIEQFLLEISPICYRLILKMMKKFELSNICILIGIVYCFAFNFGFKCIKTTEFN